MGYGETTSRTPPVGWLMNPPDTDLQFTLPAWTMSSEERVCSFCPSGNLPDSLRKTRAVQEGCTGIRF